MNFPVYSGMLDLGHYMNTNCRLRTPEDAVAYLHHMLDRHEKIGFPITDWIKGIHLQMSIERMDPKYVTFEFKYKSKEEYARFIKDQGKLLGYV